MQRSICADGSDSQAAHAAPTLRVQYATVLSHSKSKWLQTIGNVSERQWGKLNGTPCAQRIVSISNEHIRHRNASCV